MMWREKKRRERDKHNSKNLAGRVKHSDEDVLVWRCMSTTGLDNLMFIDGIIDHSQ